MDDHAAVLGPLGEVALVPGARESLEVGGVVARIAGIVPEAERHRGEGRTAHQLARGAGPQRAPVVVEHVDGHPETRPLDLSGPDGPSGIAGDEAAAQVRATGDGGQVHVTLHVPVHVLEPLRHERRTGRRDGAQRGEVVRLDRFEPELDARVEELRRGAEERDAELVGEIPQHGAPVVHRGTVVQHERRLARETGCEPVPHHPARRREVEDAVVGSDVALEPVLDEMLQQDPAGAVHDALRKTRRARGVEDVQRVVEGQRHALDSGSLVGSEPRIPERGARDTAEVGVLVDVRQHDGCGEWWEPRGDLTETHQAVVLLPVVHVPVDRDEDRRCDLPEPVDDAVRAEVG